MNRNLLIGSVIVLAALAWGCTRGPDPLTQKNRDLEVKVSKMLADVNEMQAKLTDLDQRLVREQARTRAIEQERDAVNAKLKVRTDERDTAHQQLDGLVKNLETLLSQAKAARTGTTTDSAGDSKATAKNASW